MSTTYQLQDFANIHCMIDSHHLQQLPSSSSPSFFLPHEFKSSPSGGLAMSTIVNSPQTQSFQIMHCTRPGEQPHVAMENHHF